MVDANGIGVYGLSANKAAADKILSETLSAKGSMEVVKTYPEYPSMRLSVLRNSEVSKERPALFEAMAMAAQQKTFMVSPPELKEWSELVDIACDSVIEGGHRPEARGAGPQGRAGPDGRGVQAGAGYIKQPAGSRHRDRAGTWAACVGHQGRALILFLVPGRPMSWCGGWPRPSTPST